MRWFLALTFLIITVFAFAGIECFIEKNIPSDSVPSKVIIRKIILTGNKITKDRIILREITVKENDTISPTDLSIALQQSRKNLVNTSLFNFVTVDSIPVAGSIDQLDLSFDFIERWYIWPVPIFEFADRNFNAWLKKKDWSRLNYGMFLTWNNFRGRREKVILYARFGYDEKYKLSYQIPFINKKQTWGLGVSGGFSQNHEIAYNSFDTVYNTETGKMDLLKGNKEFYFKSEIQYPKKEYFAYAEAYYRKGIHNISLFKIGYTDLELSDSVLVFNPDYSYGPSTRNQFIAFYYLFKSDYRDYKQYPLNGYYFDLEFDKKGLGILKDPVVNSLSIKANFRKYYRIKGRFYYASGLTGKISPFWDQPYYYLAGLGYGRDYVRGYEYYVVDGQHFGLWKNNLKFELVPTRVQNFNFIPTEKFSKLYYAIYINLYMDLGYVVDNRKNVYNPLANEINLGYGIGLDFVTYYDFVFRFEYSFNKEGESGFFISFMPSI
jgi:outer membrane protein assembly factor BamA